MRRKLSLPEIQENIRIETSRSKELREACIRNAITFNRLLDQTKLVHLKIAAGRAPRKQTSLNPNLSFTVDEDSYVSASSLDC